VLSHHRHVYNSGIVVIFHAAAYVSGVAPKRCATNWLTAKRVFLVVEAKDEETIIRT
jgi:hypothetical protein